MGSHRWVASHIGVSMVPAEAVGKTRTRQQMTRRWRSGRMKAGQGQAGRLRRSTNLMESAARGAAAEAAGGSGRAEAPAPAAAAAPARAACRLRRGGGRESATNRSRGWFEPTGGEWPLLNLSRTHLGGASARAAPPAACSCWVRQAGVAGRWSSPTRAEGRWRRART